MVILPVLVIPVFSNLIILCVFYVNEAFIVFTIRRNIRV